MGKFRIVYVLFMNFVSSTIFVDQGSIDFPRQLVIYENEAVASTISCTHICLRLQSDAFFDDSTCSCIRNAGYTGSNIPEKFSQSMNGIYMRLVGKANEIKQIPYFKISHNHRIATIKKIQREYRIVIDFKVDLTKMKEDTWYNVIHVTKGGEDGEFGDRHPSIFVKKVSDSTARYQVISALGNKPSYIHEDLESSSIFKDWVRVYISQTLSDGSYRYRVKVNNKIGVSRRNINPREFHDLVVYACSKWTPAYKGGRVRVAFIKGYEDIKFTAVPQLVY